MTNGATGPYERAQDRNRLFRVLSHERRRYVLRTLRRRGETNVSELAEWIARLDHDGPDDGIPQGDIRAAHLDLRHCHIPMLVDANLVSREAGGTIAPTDREIDVTAGLEALVD
jgi:DNA-binding transcriptional ArsR family regulator